MHRILIVTFSLLISVCALASPMTRVETIKDGHTIVVTGGTELRLGGIEITNERAARDLLRWTLQSSWVMVERDPDGTARVYRSPDAMFINRELVLRGYARATKPGIEPERIQATYLGEVYSGPRTVTETKAAASKSRSGTSSRSPAPRAPRAPRTSSRRPH